MVRYLKGKTNNISNPIVGILTDDFKAISPNSIFYIKFYSSTIPFQILPAAIITEDSRVIDVPSPQLVQINKYEKLKNNDIVVIHPDGTVNILFDSQSQHNGLLVTEMCNSNCIMCSQPPKNKNDIQYLYEINSRCIDLIPQECKYLGITGGEPTLLGSKLFDLLSLLHNNLPSTEIQVLTNGRLFSDLRFTHELSTVVNDNVIICIPLYADFHTLHDYVVQSKGAFYETLSGLHNLGRYNIRIELRVVIHQATVDRLANIAEFIFMNIPFVEHVAFMGLENEGYTPHNINKLWIDPKYFLTPLFNAITFLDSRDIQVSIYNLPLCLLPKPLWRFARQSISDWKNSFLDECNYCEVKSSCAGLFASSLELYHPHIKAIKNNISRYDN